MNILFVCTGNTCRSPMAEGLAKKIFPGDFSFASAGLNAFAGDTASPKAVSVMKQKGIDLESHLSARVSEQMLASAELVITMTQAHKQHLIREYPVYAEKIKTLGEWSGFGKDVIDPWGRPLESYRQCADEIEQMLRVMLQNKN